MLEAVLLVGRSGDAPASADRHHAQADAAGRRRPVHRAPDRAGTRGRGHAGHPRHVVQARGVPRLLRRRLALRRRAASTRPRTSRWAPAVRSAMSRRTSRASPDAPVLVFNGDVLTGHDIAGQVTRWQADAADVSLYLTRVDDPRAYGLVPTDDDGSGAAVPREAVDARGDRHRPDQRGLLRVPPVAHRLRSPPGARCRSSARRSRACWRRGAVVTGFVDDGYWLDLGTPLDFVQGSRDLVTGPRAEPGAAGTAPVRASCGPVPRWPPTPC